MRLAVAGKLVQVQPGIQVHAFHDDGLAIRQALHSTLGFRTWKQKAPEAQCACQYSKPLHRHGCKTVAWTYVSELCRQCMHYEVCLYSTAQTSNGAVCLMTMVMVIANAWAEFLPWQGCHPGPSARSGSRAETPSQLLAPQDPSFARGVLAAAARPRSCASAAKGNTVVRGAHCT